MNTPSKLVFNNALVAVLVSSGILLSCATAFSEPPLNASEWTVAAKTNLPDSGELTGLPTRTPLIAELELPGNVARRYQIRMEQVDKEARRVVLFDSAFDVLGIDSTGHRLQIPFWTRTGTIQCDIQIDGQTTGREADPNLFAAMIEVLAPTRQDGVDAKLPSHQASTDLDQTRTKTPTRTPAKIPAMTLIRFAEAREVLLGEQGEFIERDSLANESDDSSEVLAQRVSQWLHFQSSGGAIVDVPADQVEVWTRVFNQAGLAFVPAIEVGPEFDSQITTDLATILESNPNVALYASDVPDPNPILAAIPNQPITDVFDVSRVDEVAASTRVTNRCVNLARRLTAQPGKRVWLIPREAFVAPTLSRRAVAWTIHPIEGLHDTAENQSADAHGLVQALIPVTAATMTPPVAFLAGDTAATQSMLTRRANEINPPAIAGPFDEFTITQAAINRQASGIISAGSFRRFAQPAQQRRRNLAWSTPPSDDATPPDQNETNGHPRTPPFVHQGEGVCVSWDSVNAVGRVANVSPWNATVTMRTQTVGPVMDIAAAVPRATGELELRPYEVRRFELPISSTSLTTQSTDPSPMPSNQATTLTCTCQRRVIDRQRIVDQCELLSQIATTAQRSDLQSMAQTALVDLKEGRFESANGLLIAADWKGLAPKASTQVRSTRVPPTAAAKPLSPALSQLSLPAASSTDDLAPNETARAFQFEWIGDFGPSEPVPKISRLESKPKRTPPSLAESTTPPDALSDAPESSKSSRGAFFEFWRRFPTFNR